MATDVISNDYGDAEIISSDSGDTETANVAQIPPNAPLDFGTLNKIATNLSALSDEPTNPNEGWVYMDDGSNTPSGSLALRIYWNGSWQTVGKRSHIQDNDGDTQVKTEETNNENIVRIYAGGEEIINFDNT